MKRPIEIKAKFLGKDGSCGFRNGQVYLLWIVQDRGKIYISRRSMDAMAIPYDTMSAVKKNWELIGW